MISSSFSHSSGAIGSERPSNAPPMSASFADGSTLRRSIWAGPRRLTSRSRRDGTCCAVSPSGKTCLRMTTMMTALTHPFEPNRPAHCQREGSPPFTKGQPGLVRYESTGAPCRSRSPPVAALSPPASGERLAQSASATMGPAGGGGNFLQSLWGPQGEDARRTAASGGGAASTGDFAFGPATAAPQPRQSLLSQQRSRCPCPPGFLVPSSEASPLAHPRVARQTTVLVNPRRQHRQGQAGGRWPSPTRRRTSHERTIHHPHRIERFRSTRQARACLEAWRLLSRACISRVPVRAHTGPLLGPSAASGPCLASSRSRHRRAHTMSTLLWQREQSNTFPAVPKSTRSKKISLHSKSKEANLAKAACRSDLNPTLKEVHQEWDSHSRSYVHYMHNSSISSALLARCRPPLRLSPISSESSAIAIFFQRWAECRSH